MKPNLFVGSSTEGLNVARALEEHLEGDARVNLWTSDLFSPGGSTIEVLFDQLYTSHYAVFILTRDDFVSARGREWVGPRDNVVFELGLFMGHLGRNRTFVVHDRDTDLKIPTDLAGVTALTFSGARFLENPSAAMSPVANRLRKLLIFPIQAGELDFLKAYLAFIRPETKLSDTYSDILSQHYNTICAEVVRVEARGDWYALLEVKKRLREYFEYAGRYGEGVDFGRRYIKALTAIGDLRELLWARVKHLGYLLILDGNHQDGREELSRVLSTVDARRSDDDYRELAFYTHRYLSISFLRDRLSGDREKAEYHICQASEIAATYPQGSIKRTELEARLEGNRGNMALAAGDPWQALAHYRRSKELFSELGDYEHIGIADLKIAEALNHIAGQGGEVVRHLDNAEALFLRIGWIEGHARVLEQRAQGRAGLVTREVGSAASPADLETAISYATRARFLYDRIRNREGVGRIDALLKELEQRRAAGT